MQKNKIAIIGYGYVGKGMHKIFKDAVLYDESEEVLAKNNILGPKEDIKKRINDECELAIISVPTPMEETPNEFKPVDLTMVMQALSWLRTPYVLFKSAVPPGTCDKLNDKSVGDDGMQFCASPEYMGEGNYQITPWKYMSPTDPTTHEFQIIGGPKEARERVAEIFTRYLGPEKTYFLCEAIEAEIIKYMENSWGAVKVIFAQEFYELCKRVKASWITVREGWALDNRVERMHTAVFVDNRGFAGKCWPKDLNGIAAFGDSVGADMSLVKTALRKNKEIRQ